MSKVLEQSQSDVMICANCFRAKDDRSLLPCQNPKCHFYLRTSSDVGSESLRVRSRKQPDCSQSESDEMVGESVWACDPASLKLTRESHTFGYGRVEDRNRSLSSSAGRLAALHSGNAKVRLMSVPIYADMLEDGILVEDAFLSSPLPYQAVVSNKNTEDSEFGVSDSFTKLSLGASWSGGIPDELSENFGGMKLDIPVCRSAYNSCSSADEASSRRSPTPANKTKTSLPSPNVIPSETYSRKVFIGGLPPNVDEDAIQRFFSRFGAHTVDWPHKLQSKSCVPPKGYAFLLFKDELAVHKLLMSCINEGEKFFLFIPTGATLGRKKIQVRPWYIADSQYLADSSDSLDPRKAVFVGGVPRPLKASELVEVMNEKYGNVAFVSIDCDSELKYPKGAACVVFSSHSSYIAAVSARFMQLHYGNLDKKIEIKPYVLDGQMCDECRGVQCNGKAAPFFCGSVTCLRYYCEHCWASAHSTQRQSHRPLVKDICDRQRAFPY